MTERTNEDRAKSALCLVAYHTGSDTNTESIKEALADMLADCRHLCDTVGLSFGECDRLAHRHYLEEKHNGANR